MSNVLSKKLISLVIAFIMAVSVVLLVPLNVRAELGMAPFNTSDIMISASNVQAERGGYVDVVISLDRNAGGGISTLDLTVGYNAAVLERVGNITVGNIMVMAVQPPAGANPMALSFDMLDPTANNTAEGTLATVRFRVHGNAATGVSAITLVLADATRLDAVFDPVDISGDVTTSNGSVNVLGAPPVNLAINNYPPGDAIGQTGAGPHEAGATVTINAGNRPGYTFAHWGVPEGINIVDRYSSTTTIVLPTVDITIYANWVRSEYSISIYPDWIMDTMEIYFPGLAIGDRLTDISTLEFRIRNTGNRPTGTVNLNVQGQFITEPGSIGSLNPGGYSYFIIRPNFPLGTVINERISYEGRLIITADGGISYEIDLVFNVNPAYAAIDLNPRGPINFTSTAPQTVEIWSVGNIESGPVTVTSSNDNFIVNLANPASIPRWNRRTFTVQPAAGLGAGTHSATITVTTSPGALGLDWIPENHELDYAVRTLNVSFTGVGIPSDPGFVTVQPGQPAAVRRAATARPRASTARDRAARVPAQVPAQQQQPEPARPDFTFTIPTAAQQPVTVTVSAPGVPDGTFRVSVQGLPAEISIPDYVDVINGRFDIELLLTNMLQAGLYELIFTLYDEDGNVIFTSDIITVALEAPQELPEQEPTPPAPPVMPQPTPQPTVVRLAIGETGFTVNGVPAQGEAAPFIDPVYNRTMVPLRLVAEALGAQVSWNADTRIVSISSGGQLLSLTLDEPLPGGMGVPMIVSDRTFVPIAYVAQMLNADVRWDGDAQAVYIVN